jgi:hypothetical protein
MTTGQSTQLITVFLLLLFSLNACMLQKQGSLTIKLQQPDAGCPTPMARPIQVESTQTMTQSTSQQANQPAASESIAVTSTESDNIPNVATREAMLKRTHLAPSLTTTGTEALGGTPALDTASKPAESESSTTTNTSRQISTPCP